MAARIANARLDPCLRCALPDCDEQSRDCLRKRLINSQRAKIRAGRPEDITDAERAAAASRHREWKSMRRLRDLDMESPLGGNN